MIAALQQFHFIRPAWLLLALPAAGIWWLWKAGRDPLRGWREQMDPQLLAALATTAGGRGKAPATLLLCSWLLATVVVAGPTWKPEPNPFAEDSAPLVILLKADESMARSDPAPSRMERAQLKIRDLAGARKGQPLGLIAYAGTAHLVLPPTRDTEVVADMAAEISPAIMPASGDRLDLALALAGGLLAKQEAAGSILVVADAVDGDVAAAAEARRAAGQPPVRFLAVNTPGSSEGESLRTAARSLGARITQLAADDTDVGEIVRAAARPPVSRGGEAGAGTRWQEGGYLLLVPLAALVAMSFRRVTGEETEDGE